MRFFTAALVATLVTAATASAQEDESMVRARIITALMTHAREPLKGHKFCDSFTGLEGTKPTVGSFVAWSLAFMEKGVDNSVTVKWEPWKEGAPWKRGRSQCDVNLNADSKGESPWSCGLRFEQDDARKNIDAKSLQCIGTC